MIARLARSAILIPMFAGAIAAQAPSQATPDSAAAVAVVDAGKVRTGPVMSPSAVTSKLSRDSATTLPAQSPGENVGQSRAMMGAGIAAVLLGLIVGGDAGMLVAIGGAMFALVGLYHYMR
jgi:hypothetical protein